MAPARARTWGVRGLVLRTCPFVLGAGAPYAQRLVRQVRPMLDQGQLNDARVHRDDVRARVEEHRLRAPHRVPAVALRARGAVRCSSQTVQSTWHGARGACGLPGGLEGTGPRRSLGPGTSLGLRDRAPGRCIRSNRPGPAIVSGDLRGGALLAMLGAGLAARALAYVAILAAAERPAALDAVLWRAAFCVSPRRHRA